MTYVVPLCAHCENFNKEWHDVPNCLPFPEIIPERIAEGGPCDFVKPGEPAWNGKTIPPDKRPAVTKRRMAKRARPQRLTRSRRTRHD